MNAPERAVETAIRLQCKLGCDRQAASWMALEVHELSLSDAELREAIAALRKWESGR